MWPLSFLEKKALLLSRDNRAPIATATIQLVPAKQKQLGFLMFYPVFKEKIADSLEGDDKLQVYVVGAYNITQLLNSTLKNTLLPINIKVEDTSTPPNKLIYSHTTKL